MYPCHVFSIFSFSKEMLLQMLVSRKYIHTIQCYCNSQPKNDHNESQDITSQGRGTDGGRPCRKLCETLKSRRCQSTCPSVQWGFSPSPRTTRWARWWEEGSCVCSINHQSINHGPTTSHGGSLFKFSKSLSPGWHDPLSAKHNQTGLQELLAGQSICRWS